MWLWEARRRQRVHTASWLRLLPLASQRTTPGSLTQASPGPHSHTSSPSVSAPSPLPLPRAYSTHPPSLFLFLIISLYHSKGSFNISFRGPYLQLALFLVVAFVLHTLFALYRSQSTIFIFICLLSLSGRVLSLVSSRQRVFAPCEPCPSVGKRAFGWIQLRVWVPVADSCLLVLDAKGNYQEHKGGFLALSLLSFPYYLSSSSFAITSIYPSTPPFIISSACYHHISLSCHTAQSRRQDWKSTKG